MGTLRLAGVLAFLSAFALVAPARAQAPAPEEAFAPGNHVGFTIRTTTGGDAIDHTEWNDGGETYDRYETWTLGAAPGFGVHWEHLTDGRIAAPGMWLGVQLYAFEQYDWRFNLGAELQIDPRLRIFLARAGWWRPYLQGAAGLSVGIPSKSVSNRKGEYRADEYVKYAIAVNASGGIGSLFAPAGCPVAFFLDLGIESVFFWYKMGVAEEEHDGHTRQLVVALGLEI